MVLAILSSQRCPNILEGSNSSVTRSMQYCIHVGKYVDVSALTQVHPSGWHLMTLPEPQGHWRLEAIGSPAMPRKLEKNNSSTKKGTERFAQACSRESSAPMM